jgi:hypothetical protein
VIQDNELFKQAIDNNQSFYGKFFAVPIASLDGETVADHPGNLGRNTFRNAGWSNVDFAVAKDTHIVERVSLQFRCEFFNLLNQHAFSIPGRNLGSNDFGISTSTMFDPRQIQLGLRLIF